MTSATSIARRDMILAAGAGLATGLLGGANAQPAAAQSGEFWTAEYTARKGEVSLAIDLQRHLALPGRVFGRPDLLRLRRGVDARLSTDDLAQRARRHAAATCAAAARGYGP